MFVDMKLNTIAPKFIDLPKPRTTEILIMQLQTEVGNFVRVTNVFGSPDLSPFISGEIAEPYRTIELQRCKNASKRNC